MTNVPAPGPADLPPTSPSGRRKRSRRGPILALAAILAAAALAGSSALTWWRRDYQDPLSGPVHTTLNGGAMVGELIAIAAVAVAGLGAALASRGWLRRAVGGLLLVVGVVEVVRVLLAWTSSPQARLQAALARPATPDGPATLDVVGPLLAVTGAVLLVVTGVLVLVTASSSAGMGAAYEAPGARKSRARSQAAGRTASGRGNRAPDDGELWRAIDAGLDPTDTEPTDTDPTCTGPTATDRTADADSDDPSAGREK